MLGAGQARYRMDDEASAVAIWEKILELPETPSSYFAWREVAAARVRDGDLQGAIAAYREADRRAPPQDKPEIANRLGWLAKETGNVRASRRYFARGRGAVMPIATYALMGITIAISLTASISAEGAADLQRPAARQGGGCRRRVLAPVLGRARARRADPPRLQHVRAVSLRAPDRTDLRPGPDAGVLLRRGPGSVGSDDGVRRRPARGRRIGRDLRPVRDPVRCFPSAHADARPTGTWRCSARSAS